MLKARLLLGEAVLRSSHHSSPFPGFSSFFLAQTQGFWGTDPVDADLKNSGRLV